MINNDMDEYLRKYCEKHKITKEEAMECKLVKEVLGDYESGVLAEGLSDGINKEKEEKL